MAAVPNQFLLYDSAVAQWITDNFIDCIAGKIATLLVGTPDRAFAEFVTPTTETPRDGRPPLPRISVTIEDPERDADRFNPNTIRLLGYTDPTQYALRRANYPVPIRLPYTLNFWTEKYREMNLFEQQLLQLFRFNYLNISVDIDSIAPAVVYGTKNIELYLDSGIINTGDVEPGSKERVLRRTVNIHLNAWIWDFNFQQATSLKEVEFQIHSDRDLSTLLETVSTPHRETLVSGVDGIDTDFGPIDTLRTPIIEGTFLVDATVGGTGIRGRDDTAGNIVDPVSSGVTGTINYSTGEVSLAYTNAPDSSTDITVAYFTTIS